MYLDTNMVSTKAENQQTWYYFVGRLLGLVIQGETDVFLNGPASSGFHREPPKQQLETARQTAGLVDAAGRSYSGSG